MADMVNADCVHIRWLDAFCPVLVMFGAHSWLLWMNDSLLRPSEKCNFMFPLSLGSADTLVRWSEKLYHLSAAYFLWSIPDKNYQNPTMHTRVTAKMSGIIFMRYRLRLQRVRKQDPNAGNSRVADCKSQKYRNTISDTFGRRSSTCQLARYDFLLVLCVGWLDSRVVRVLDSGAESLGSNRSRDAVFGKLFTFIVPLFTKQRNW